jgi:hypothetical protein
LQEEDAKGLLRHLLGWPSQDADSNPSSYFPLPASPSSTSTISPDILGRDFPTTKALGPPSEEEQAAIVDQVYKVGICKGGKGDMLLLLFKVGRHRMEGEPLALFVYSDTYVCDATSNNQVFKVGP